MILFIIFPQKCLKTAHTPSEESPGADPAALPLSPTAACPPSFSTAIVGGAEDMMVVVASPTAIQLLHICVTMLENCTCATNRFQEVLMVMCSLGRHVVK